MKTDIVYNIIKNHADKESDLFLLDAPTGFGKTYNAIKYIQKNYKNKKFFFIANQLKLLPNTEEMVKDLNNNDADELKKQLLYLSSYYDSFKNYFDTSYEKMDIEFKAMNNKLLKTLKSLVKNLKEEKNAEIKQLFYDKFTSTEYEFRKQVKAYLKLKKYKKKEIQELEWLTNLYPAILLEKKQIVLLTTKKFFLPIDMIYENSILLYTKQFNNSILFIDEFDTTKQVLLDIIIENTNKNYKIDCFRLFRILQNTFEKNILEEYSKAWNNEDITKTIKYLKELFSNINKKYQYILNYPFKLKDQSLITKHFIFNDDVTLTIGKDTDKKAFYIYHDQNDRYNYIVKKEKKDIEDNYIELEKICQSVINCINEFCEKMIFIIDGYREFYNKTKPELESNFASQDGCSTVIDFLNIGEENKKFIINQILQNYTNIIKSKKYIFENIDNSSKKTNKYNFYENGFSYLEVKDDIQHNLESKCYLYSYNTTPEKIIASTAMNYHVIGISATSSFKSALVNYDLDYLKQTLDIDNLFPDKQEQILIQNHYDKSNEEIYNDVKININFVGGKEESSYFEEVWKDLFDNKYIVTLNDHKKVINDNRKYLYKTMANLYKVFKDFILDNKKSSFIYFLTFNLNNQKNLVDLSKLTLRYLINDRDDIKYAILDSSEFDKNYENLKKEYLEKGKRVFIITNYNTIGAGINLQYKITSDNLKHNLHLKIDNERDYDGIFLSKPTNIIPSIEKSYFDYDKLAYAIYALEYLKAGKQIHYKNFKNSVNNLFIKTLLNRDVGYDLLIYHKYEMVCIGAAKILLQALGRICRTDNKNKMINIYVDNDNLNYLYPILDTLKSGSNNYEFNKILENIKIEDINSETLTYAKFKKINEQANKYIWSILSYYKKWNSDKINEWRNLREFVLKYPTCNSSVDSDLLQYYFNFDEEVKEYSYNKIYKYLNDVSPDITKFKSQMSFADCGLEKALNHIPGLKEYFIDKEYATTFEKNKYLLSVDLYQRIYKGAIGEVIGKYLLSCYDIELCPIDNPDHFERFDYYCNDVYFDFKNWHEDFLKEEKEQVTKTISKAEEIGARKVFVINVFSKNYKREQTFKNKLITVPWLYDIKNNKINEEIIFKIKMILNS